MFPTGFFQFQFWIIFTWIFFSFIGARIAKRMMESYWTGFYVCLILTPVLGIPFILVGGKNKLKYYHACKFCKERVAKNETFCTLCGKDAEGRTRYDYSPRDHTGEKEKFNEKFLL